MSTFEEPNANLILDSEEKKIKKTGNMTKAEIDTLNKEETDYQYQKGRGPVATDDLIVDTDEDPLMKIIPKGAVEYIEAFSEEEEKATAAKEDRARKAYRIWQSQQVDWIALVFTGISVEGKATYQKRVYRYHDSINEQTDEIQSLMRKVEDLETRKNYLQFMANRNAENLKEWRETNFGKTIDDAVRELRNLRMEYYFGETNSAIVDMIRTNDVRDLIDAAIYRENNLPLSRKRMSSGILSKESGSAEQKKK